MLYIHSAHNEMTDSHVAVNLGHKFYAAHQRYVSARTKIKEASEWVWDLDETDLTLNVLKCARPGRSPGVKSEPQALYEMRYAIRYPHARH